jgi:two-component sensor histidine kinase
VTHPDDLLRELNHRVKNNFQIIVSLMNLKARMLPPDRRDDIRFLQEHVQCMAIAYRLVYDTGDMTEVPVGALLNEAVAELRQLAKLDSRQLSMTGEVIDDAMGLDQAIAFGSFLAVLLPPYLDHARTGGGTVMVAASVVDRMLTLAVSGSWSEPVQSDALRHQLYGACLRQLQAEVLAVRDPSGVRFRFPLDARRPAISRSVLERT